MVRTKSERDESSNRMPSGFAWWDILHFIFFTEQDMESMYSPSSKIPVYNKKIIPG